MVTDFPHKSVDLSEIFPDRCIGRGCGRSAVMQVCPFVHVRWLIKDRAALLSMFASFRVTARPVEACAGR